ncbi:unnamed protein product, partial [Heterotrigona itama]
RGPFFRPRPILVVPRSKRKGRSSFKSSFHEDTWSAGPTSSPVRDRCEPAEISLERILQLTKKRKKKKKEEARTENEEKRLKIRTADTIVTDRLVLVDRGTKKEDKARN